MPLIVLFACVLFQSDIWFVRQAVYLYECQLQIISVSTLLQCQRVQKKRVQGRRGGALKEETIIDLLIIMQLVGFRRYHS